MIMKSAKEIVAIAKSALFCCSICQEKIRDPVLLLCNHSFCSTCLKKYLHTSPVKNNKTFKCPNCSKVFTKRSSYSASDIEGQLFQDLITLIEAETGVDLTDIPAKHEPLITYDKQRYIQQNNEENNCKKSKRNSNKIKESKQIETCTSNNNNNNNDNKAPKRTTRKRTLSNPKSESIAKRKKNEEIKTPSSKIEKSTDSTRNQNNCDVQARSTSKKSKKNPISNKKIEEDIETKTSVVEISSEDSTEIKMKCHIQPRKLENDDQTSKDEDVRSKASNEKVNKDVGELDNSSTSNFLGWDNKKWENVRTYKTRNRVTTTNIDTIDEVDQVQRVQEWLKNIKRSKSLTPIKNSITNMTRPKRKSLNELMSKSPIEIARNLESEAINDLLKIPSSTTKDNWKRVKSEFRTPVFKKLNLSTVQPGTSRKRSKRNGTNETIDVDEKFKMTTRVVLENYTQKLSSSTNLTTVDPIDQLVIEDKDQNMEINRKKLSSNRNSTLVDLIDQLSEKDEEHVNKVMNRKKISLNKNSTAVDLIDQLVEDKDQNMEINSRNSTAVDLIDQLIQKDEEQVNKVMNRKKLSSIINSMAVDPIDQLIERDEEQVNKVMNRKKISSSTNSTAVDLIDQLIQKDEEQINREINRKKLPSNTNSTAVDLIDQLTTNILNGEFSSFFIRKNCVYLSKKIREIFNLKEIQINENTNLLKKEIGTNTENLDNSCPNCRQIENLNELIESTQKIIPSNNIIPSTQRTNKMDPSTQRNNKMDQSSSNRLDQQNNQSPITQVNKLNQNSQSSLKKQLSGDIFIETEKGESISESSQNYYTPKNISNTSKFMQHIICDMELTQTLPSKDYESQKDPYNSPNILSNEDDDDIIESTPKSNKSSRILFTQQPSQRKSESEHPSIILGTEFTQKVPRHESENPSIILGTEFTQNVPRQLKRKKRSSNDDDQHLDVTLIEPIETQPNSIPIVMDLPPPTEFMDTEEDDRSHRNNLNNFSSLPEATMLKNIKTPGGDINIQQLKEGTILSEPENVPSIESVIEQTPLSCYPPKSRINLSNTKAFKQVSKQVYASDSESDENALEIVKDNTPKRLYNGPSNSKQLSILSYVNASQEKLGSQVKLSQTPTASRMNPPSLPISMSSSQRRNDMMNESFKSQFDTPSSQLFTRPMASSTPTRSVGVVKYHRLNTRSQREIEVLWTRLSVSQISLLMDFCKQFNIRYTTDNVDTATHLITRVDENNYVEDYTLKYVCAVARGIWVLSFKWIEDSMDNNKILPEEPFEALDTTGNPGPRMSRLRERTSVLFEKFAVCVVSSPTTFPKDKLINCILQNGGKIYDTVEDLAARRDGKIRLIITDTPETQDMHTYQDYYEKYGLLSIITEWVFNTIAIFKVESLVSYLVCTVTEGVAAEYPEELLIESEAMCDSIM